MPVDVTMPKLSDTMEEGKILKWLKHPGDRVAIGEIIAEVETDKANMELEAYDEGTLAEVRVPEGESAPVGAVIAVLAAPGDGVAARPAAGAGKAAAAAEMGVLGIYWSRATWLGLWMGAALFTALPQTGEGGLVFMLSTNQAEAPGPLRSLDSSELR